MSVPAAYLGVILIWATTPLTIKWSGESVGPFFGSAARMSLSVLFCAVVLLALRHTMPWHRDARRTYYITGIALLVSMSATYWGAQSIPSGLISVIFGTTPLLTSMMAYVWLGEHSVTPAKITGIIISIIGLSLIFHSSFVIDPAALLGGLAVLVASVGHSLSAVLVKRVNADISALASTTGSLLIALPGFWLMWWWMEGIWPVFIPDRVAYSIVYLALFGSVIGFVLYYFLLRRITATKTALITLITPVLALVLGHLLNGEALAMTTWWGTAGVLIGLALHQWGDRWVLLIVRSRAG